jgi:hypothetical protein
MMGRCMAMHGNVHISSFVVISWCIKTRWQCTGSGVHRWFSPLSGSSPHGSLWGTRSGIAMNGTNLVCLESQLWCLKVQSQEIRSGLGSQVPTKTKWNGSGMVSKTPKKILQMTQMTGTRVSFVGSWNTTRETNNSNETNDSNECFILVLWSRFKQHPWTSPAGHLGRACTTTCNVAGPEGSGSSRPGRL